MALRCRPGDSVMSGARIGCAARQDGDEAARSSAGLRIACGGGAGAACLRLERDRRPVTGRVSGDTAGGYLKPA
jgi:hypothetical protein